MESSSQPFNGSLMSRISLLNFTDPPLTPNQVHNLELAKQQGFFLHLFPTKSTTLHQQSRRFLCPLLLLFLNQVTTPHPTPNSSAAKLLVFSASPKLVKHQSPPTEQGEQGGRQLGRCLEGARAGRPQTHTALTAHSASSSARSIFLTAFGQFPIPLNGCFQPFCSVLYLL